MQWSKSSLNPPLWWQLHLASGMLEISIQHKSKSSYWLTGKQVFHQEDGYYVSIGHGLSLRQAVFPTLEEAQQWGINEAKKVSKQIINELKPPRYYLLEVCLLVAIALLIVWLIGDFGR